jgi:hypothetical protein
LRTANRTKISLNVPQQVIDEMDVITYKLSLPTRSDSFRHLVELGRSNFKYVRVPTTSKDNTRILSAMVPDTLANFISDKATIHKVPTTKILRYMLKAGMEEYYV